MNNQCKDCKCNVNGICIVAFMPVDRAMAYLGECECEGKNTKFKQNLPNIIGFSGFARAGKDTCADIAKEILPGYSRSSFAHRLKYECSLMLSMVDDDFPNLFETEDKVKYRDFLVFWGKFRRKLQPDYWIKKLEDKSSLPVSSKTIISDVRYPNEVEWIHENKGVVIYVSRPSAVPANSEELNTINEILRNGMEDYRIDNTGNLEDLKIKVIKLISEIVYAERIHKGVSGDT